MRTELPYQCVDEEQLKGLLGFKPVEKLGQNFLVDPGMIQKFVTSTINGADVVEIGCGPGNLTVGIARRAAEVVGIEIFPGFSEAQKVLLRDCPNVKILNQNALVFDYEGWINSDVEARHQVIGNIPFHISEPLLTMLAGISSWLEDITLLVGGRLAETMAVLDPRSDRYTRMSFVASVFDIGRKTHVPRKCFWPVPRTDSDIVSLTYSEYPKNGRLLPFLVRRSIVASATGNLSLSKVLDSLSIDSEDGKVRGKEGTHRFNRRQTRNELRQMAISYNTRVIDERKTRDNGSVRTSRLSERIQLPRQILSKPFGRLDNQEVRQLAVAIDNL